MLGLAVISAMPAHGAGRASPSGQNARAQAIMQEHARVAARNLRLALRSERALALVPGRALIRPANGAAGDSLTH